LYKIFFFLFLSLISIEAKEKTVQAVGMGISYISLPEYIGSSNQQQFLLPYPYIYYKSEKLTIKKNKISNHLYKKANQAIDISFSGTVPVKCDKDSLRYGMIDLDPTFEVGPNFIHKLYKFEDKKSYINIEFPVRTVWAVNLKHIRSIGYNFSPNIYLKYFYSDNLTMSFSSGPTFATSKYNDYFYAVNNESVNNSREEFNSSGGYTGLKNSIVFSYEKDKLIMSSFLRYYDLENVKFENSPLVSKKNAFFYGMFLSYVF